MIVSRRTLLSSIAPGAVAVSMGGCALFQQNANGSYGLSAAVITAIQNAVQAVAKYAPAVESIAATAASLFGAQYGAIVTVGSNAINQVIAYLQNLVANPPTLGARLKATGVYARYGIPTPTSGVLVGYTKNGVPVFSQ
jgi:hypothetical protein